MDRLDYFNFIERKLGELGYRIETRGSLNLLELHLHSEDFYQHFINLLFDWKLENLNIVQQNTPGIDLVDSKNKIVAQVSATATKQKIESALTKDLSRYKDYSFKFISISKNAEDLRTKTFTNPHNLIFLPTKDIFDIKSLLASIKGMPVEKMKEVYDFLKEELKSEPDPEKMESNIANIIKVLSKEDWSHGASSFETVPYDIEDKITYNQLDKARNLIDDYKIHYFRIDQIYSDFDRLGMNKSISILSGIRMEYLALGTIGTPDQRFFEVIEKVTQRILASSNYTPIPDEELSLCVQILVVDAFIRCKIFKNPLGNADARS
jgi:hypothetical protein